MLTVAEYAKHFDMAVLAQDSREEEIRSQARAARAADVAAYYTTPCWTATVAEELAGSDVHVGAAAAFPYGTLTTKVKFAEIEDALANGATAVDLVVNIGALKDRNLGLVEREVAGLVERCRGRALSKLIYEVGFLSDDDIVTLTRICCDAGVDYVKTSTGSEGLPTEHHVTLMRDHLTNGTTKLKLSGVPRTFTLAATLWMLDMGVELIGTRSAAKLVDQYASHLAARQLS